jgi:acetyl-CoA/propionyl-CoA carboxylase biotin carboxyl carrier protein
VPGTPGPGAGADEVVAFAAGARLPVAIKAAFGGGGRGLKVARTLEEIPELFDSAVREAVAAFGRGECFVERYLDRRATSRPRCWPTSTATSSSSAPATARCSAATRSWSRRRRRRS